MDSTALQELIAQVRGTTAALAEAEQKVASFTSELAQQAPLAQPELARGHVPGQHGGGTSVLVRRLWNEGSVPPRKVSAKVDWE
jgi:hypothetical protein